MGLLDGIVGGLVGGEMVSVVNGLIQKHGGVQGIVAQFEQQGLGATVKSWVGTGANQPISTEQLHQVLGAGTIQALATKFGLDPQVVSQRLTQILPQAIDKLTPTGVVPPA